MDSLVQTGSGPMHHSSIVVSCAGWDNGAVAGALSVASYARSSERLQSLLACEAHIQEDAISQCIFAISATAGFTMLGLAGSACHG